MRPFLLLLTACNQPAFDEPGLWPFPSAHLVADDGTLDVQGMPRVSTPFPTERIARHRGFSRVQTAVVDLGDSLDATTLPGLDDIGTTGSVQMWDLTDGAAIPMFAEQDANSDLGGEHPTLLMRPQVPVPAGHRVAVVITDDVETEDGDVPVVEWFEAVRDGKAKGELEAWNDHYLSLLDDLDSLGVDTEAVVLAFDYPVDDATPRLSNLADTIEATDSWTFDIVDTQGDGTQLTAGTWRRALGSFDVPSVLGDDGRYVLDESGNATIVGSTTADIAVLIPDSVRDAEPGTVPVWMYGHGLFSDPWTHFTSLNDDDGIVELADDAGVIMVATPWVGLEYNDLVLASQVIQDMGRIDELTDRAGQGLVNAVALSRLLRRGDVLSDPVFESLADPDSIFVFGQSLGGLLGGVLVAVDDDIEHAALPLGGGAWSLTLERSGAWVVFEQGFADAVPSGRDRQLLLAASQMFWDPVDPVGYGDELQGRSILWQMMLGDDVVPNVGTHVTLRAAQATALLPAVEVPWGLDSAEGPLGGPAVAIYDPGLERPPEANTPAPGTGAHTKLGNWPESREQLKRFLDPADPGVVEHTCGEGPCLLE